MKKSSALILKSAAAQVQRVMNSLDTKQTPCSCCNLKLANNWDELRLYRELEATQKKLLRLAGWGGTSGVEVESEEPCVVDDVLLDS